MRKARIPEKQGRIGVIEADVTLCFRAEQVTIEGRSNSWVNLADSGNRITFHFCPDCGSDVHYEINGKFDGLIAIPLGAFEDPFSLEPRFSVWEKRKCDWVEISGEVEHSD